MSKENHLREEFKSLISRFEKESSKHKKLYRILRYIALGLTGSATIMASAALTFNEVQVWLNLAVVIATASAGIATSVEGLRKPAELWIHERNILYALKDLDREMEYEAAETGSVKDADNYFQRLQQILSASKDEWSGQVMPSNQGKS